tara:strand:- start:171 stop:470 length:300 start_codon:yes stop_codon:yes gene_type:complete
MKKFFLLFISFLFLTGCAQSVALLGPAFTLVKTGSIQQVFVGESLNQGIKNETGKDVSEHVKQFLNKDVKNQECEDNSSNELQKIFFNTIEDTDCKKIQ